MTGDAVDPWTKKMFSLLHDVAHNGSPRVGCAFYVRNDAGRENSRAFPRFGGRRRDDHFTRPHAHSYGFSSQQARETCRGRAVSLACPLTELVHDGDFSIGCRAQRGSYGIVITSQSYCPGATELAEGPPNPEATRCRDCVQTSTEDVFFWGKRTSLHATMCTQLRLFVTAGKETCRATAANRLPWPLRSLSCLPSDRTCATVRRCQQLAARARSTVHAAL